MTPNMIQWNMSPEILSLGIVSIRWYGLLFATSFVLGFRLIEKIFAFEKVSAEHLDRLFIYMVVGTIAGARLGHCLFYEPDIYLANPIQILKIWEGGLASHGAALGIFGLLALYCRKYRLNWIWLVDRLCLAVALSGGLIRLGNLFNSEILGRPADVPWSFVFRRIDLIPRHPTQIYESITYFVTFGILNWLYWKKKKGVERGFLFGLFLILVFGGRFFLEFFKENQVAFEASLPLNMGQLLSLPLVTIGVVLVLRSKARRLHK